MAGPQWLVQRAQEVAFYQRVLAGLQPGQLIFDIGANQGFKTDLFLRLGARVIAVDPDATNQTILRQRFLQYRLKPKPVTIVGEAVSDQVGTTTFWIDAPGSAKNTLNQKWVETLRHDDQRFGKALEFRTQLRVPTTTLDQLMRQHGTPYFVKIDVEGHEPGVLMGLQRPVPYCSFEVNLPEFLTEGQQCIARLQAVDPAGEFNYSVDCLHGLAFPRWLSGPEFVQAFAACPEPSIEVFWRTAVR